MSEQLSLIGPSAAAQSEHPAQPAQAKGDTVSPEIAQSQCLGNLGKLVAEIADFRRSQTGSRVAGNCLSGDQGIKADRLRSEIPENFRNSRATARSLYSSIGSAMCEGCLGRDACPFRTYVTDYSSQQAPHINPDSNDATILTKMLAWYASLKSSARNNIKNGKVTPVTINQSHNGISKAHRATAA